MLEATVAMIGACFCFSLCGKAYVAFKKDPSDDRMVAVLIIFAPLFIYFMVRFARWAWDVPIPFTR